MKTKTLKQQNAKVTTEFVGSFTEFTDTIGGHSRGKASSRKTTGKKSAVPLHDRRRLMDIEIFLNNCLNLAQAVESKEMTKAIQLLSEARDEIQRDA